MSRLIGNIHRQTAAQSLVHLDRFSDKFCAKTLSGYVQILLSQGLDMHFISHTNLLW